MPSDTTATDAGNAATTDALRTISAGQTSGLRTPLPPMPVTPLPPMPVTPLPPMPCRTISAGQTSRLRSAAAADASDTTAADAGDAATADAGDAATADAGDAATTDALRTISRGADVPPAEYRCRRCQPDVLLHRQILRCLPVRYQNQRMTRVELQRYISLLDLH